MRRPRVRLDYDREVDAAYLSLRSGKVAISEEVEPGLIVDLDKGDRIVGVEILRFSRRFTAKARGGVAREQRLAV